MEIQILFNGLVSGLVLALLAVAFYVVYVPCRVFHIAMGGIFSLTPFVAYFILDQHITPLLSFAASVFIAIVVSLLVEKLNHSVLERKRASEGAHLISSLGIYIIIVEVLVMVWGNEAQVFTKGIDKVFVFGPARITSSQAVAGLVSAFLLIALYVWLRFTRIGLNIRALAENPTEFALQGYNTNFYRLFVFGLSGFLAGMAALLTANDIGFDPHGGLHMLVLAIVAVLIGGRGNLLGPIIGGIFVGVIRALVVWYLSARWQDVATFLLLALFLYLRPNGIIGKKGRLEATA